MGFAEVLLRDGRAALGRGDAAGASAAFVRALSLWTGEPLEGLTNDGFAVEARRRLDELRLSVVEARNDALLVEGRHLEVLADIERFLDAAPLREHLQAQHVAALYRAGRQAEALRVCAALRQALRKLGLDPSPAMQDLERLVLDQDPGLLARHAGFITPLPASTAEALPFVGRDDEYEQVLSWFAEAVRDGVRVAVVEGDAGIGKSRFLLEIARKLARDAIVLPVHVHDVFRPALHEFARVLAEANLRLSDAELQQMMDDVPDVTAETARIRQVASAFVANRASNRSFPDERFLRHVAPWIAALSAKAPVVIVVDDLPTVGSSFLRVVWELTMLSTPKRVLIIGSTRAPVDHTLAPGLGRTLHALDRRGLLRRIRMAPLSADDVNDLLERMYVAPRGELVGPLYALTAGNPFMLAETLSLGTPEQVVGQWSSPPRVRDVARQRTSELGRATAELLGRACLFETDFTLEAIAHATGTTAATAAALVDRAVTARVLQPSTLTSYCFAHQLFRHALIGDLSVSERQAGHRAIAGALEETGATAAQLATHWSGSTGPDVPANIAQYARAAGREAMRLFEPNTAAEWFALALDNLSADSERGALLVELADARQLAGDPRSHATLQEAVELALATNDDELTVAIVRASSSGWVHLLISGAARLLARALEVVNDDATRARILARQAVDVGVNDPPAAERIADEAVAVARLSGDTSALAEALLRRMSVSLAPHNLAARQCALPELLKVSAHSTDIPTRYFALSTAVLTAIQAGDLRKVDEYGAQADSLSLSYAIAPMQWSTMVRRAWRTGLAGRLDDAERLIEQARTYGTDAAIAGAEE
ncbi:MAG TPA: BTAD domain-containing putative transcriptional regulator, partial [Acidimicrobiia bacterium]|nr:BTAD domain-containing putative transcriptional regulator [Acidimicrobiia bacterium]